MTAPNWRTRLTSMTVSGEKLAYTNGVQDIMKAATEVMVALDDASPFQLLAGVPNGNKLYTENPGLGWIPVQSVRVVMYPEMFEVGMDGTTVIVWVDSLDPVKILDWKNDQWYLHETDTPAT